MKISSTLLFLSIVMPSLLDAQADIPLSVRSTGEIQLAGTLYLPKGDGPFPVTILTHGSERGDRTHPGYLRWSERFRSRGLGVLIFDKRGVGESGGEYVEAPDLTQPAEDVIAWVDLLKRRSDILADKIGVLGWSQGGWTGPLAASLSDGLSYVVSISGPAVSPLEQNIFDKTNQLAGTVTDAQKLADGSRAIRLVMTYLVTGEQQDAAELAWAAVSDEAWFKQGYQGARMFDRDSAMNNPRMQSFVAHNAYDPIPALESLQIPMLAVFGGADRIVPVERSIEALRAAFAASEAGELTLQVFEGANHGIDIRVDGRMIAVPGYHDFVLEWIEGVLR